MALPNELPNELLNDPTCELFQELLQEHLKEISQVLGGELSGELSHGPSQVWGLDSAGSTDGSFACLREREYEARGRPFACSFGGVVFLWMAPLFSAICRCFYPNAISNDRRK